MLRPSQNVVAPGKGQSVNQATMAKHRYVHGSGYENSRLRYTSDDTAAPRLFDSKKMPDLLIKLQYTMLYVPGTWIFATDETATAVRHSAPLE